MRYCWLRRTVPMSSEQRSVLAIVPARRGSKRLPGKNLLKVGQTSLFERAVDCGLRAKSVNTVVVSSNDPDVLEACVGLNVVPLDRPDALSNDTSSQADVIRDVFRQVGVPSLVVLLQPTSPFRKPSDVDEAVALLDSHPDAPSVTTGSALPHPIEWSFEIDEGKMDPAFGWDSFTTRSQDLPPRFTLNGSVYVARGDYMAGGGELVAPGTRILEMPGLRSIDVDTNDDLRVATALEAYQPEGKSNGSGWHEEHAT